MEKTLVFIKPDGVRRKIMGELLTRFERRGFSILQLKMMMLSEELVARHYEEHLQKFFYSELKEYVMSGPIVVMVLGGANVIKIVRRMMGVTNPAEADPGTIRGDYCVEPPYNLLHASDSPEAAEREIRTFFS